MTQPSEGGKTGRADVVTAIVLLALGLAMLMGGLGMDRLEIRQIHPLSIPGLVPIALGAALAISAVILLIGAVRDGALKARAGAEMPEGLWRLGAAVGLCFAYPLLLIRVAAVLASDVPLRLGIYCCVRMAGAGDRRARSRCCDGRCSRGGRRCRDCAGLRAAVLGAPAMSGPVRGRPWRG